MKRSLRRPFSTHRWWRFFAAVVVTLFLFKNLVLSVSLVSRLPQREPSIPVKIQISERRWEKERSKSEIEALEPLEIESVPDPKLDSWAKFLP